MKQITNYILEKANFLVKKHVNNKLNFVLNPRTSTNTPKEFDVYKIKWPPNKSAVGVIADNVDNKKEFTKCYALITSSGFVTVNGAIGIYNDDNEIVNPSDEDLELLQSIMKYYFDNNCTNLVSRGIVGKIKNGEFMPMKDGEFVPIK